MFECQSCGNRIDEPAIGKAIVDRTRITSRNAAPEFQPSQLIDVEVFALRKSTILRTVCNKRRYIQSGKCKLHAS